MKIRNKDNQPCGQLKKPAMWLYCVILCVALLVSFTLAWYVSSAGSVDNRIVSSTFDMTVSIVKGESGIALTAKEDGSKAASLGEGTYTVSLGCTNKTTGHGCCAVTINGKAYQTNVFGKCGVINCSKCGGCENIQFTITVPEGETWQINFASLWGAKTPAEGVELIKANTAIGAAG